VGALGVALDGALGATPDALGVALDGALGATPDALGVALDATLPPAVVGAGLVPAVGERLADEPQAPTTRATTNRMGAIAPVPAVRDWIIRAPPLAHGGRSGSSASLRIAYEARAIAL